MMILDVGTPVIQRNNCGCGSTRQRTVLTTCSWTLKKRLGSESCRKPLSTHSPLMVRLTTTLHVGNYDSTKITCIEGQSKISLHVIVSVQPHSAGKAAEGASGAVITATTDSGPQQAPYTLIVSVM